MSETPAVYDAERSERIKHGRRYPDELKEIAYEYWVFSHSRNATAVSKTIADEWRGEWGTPPDPLTFARTVQEWVVKYDWQSRVRKDFAAIAPNMDHAIISGLLLNAMKAIPVVANVLDGKDTGLDSRTRIIAAMGALDHAGYDPRTMGDRVRGQLSESGDPISSASLLDLTPDELAERLSKLRDEPIDIDGSE